MIFEDETKDLRIVLNKERFMAIANGMLNEHYLEMKEYWVRRLTDEEGKIRHFDTVTFSYGFTKTKMVFRMSRLFDGYGNVRLGAPEDEKVFIIVAGQRLR